MRVGTDKTGEREAEEVSMWLGSSASEMGVFGCVLPPPEHVRVCVSECVCTLSQVEGEVLQGIQ